MFKFLKSKKGFTLVELMIVVVIMAILVAVAVPIYNAVTDNARKKTCIGNQRNIVSQINTNVMSGAIALVGDGKKITITTNDTGDGLDSIVDGGVFVETDDQGAKFKTLFNDKNMPYCPVADGKIEVTVNKVTGGGCKVTTECKTADVTGHTL